MKKSTASRIGGRERARTKATALLSLVALICLQEWVRKSCRSRTNDEDSEPLLSKISRVSVANSVDPAAVFRRIDNGSVLQFRVGVLNHVELEKGKQPLHSQTDRRPTDRLRLLALLGRLHRQADTFISKAVKGSARSFLSGGEAWR